MDSTSIWALAPIAVAVLLSAWVHRDNPRLSNKRSWPWFACSVLFPYGIFAWLLLKKSNWTKSKKLLPALLIGLFLGAIWTIGCAGLDSTNPKTLASEAELTGSEQIPSAQIEPSNLDQEVEAALKAACFDVFQVETQDLDPNLEPKQEPYRWISVDVYYRSLWDDAALVNNMGLSSMSILKALQEKYPNTYKTVMIRGFVDLTDQYGASERDKVLKLEYPMAEVNKVQNWSHVGVQGTLNFATPSAVTRFGGQALSAFCSNSTNQKYSSEFCLKAEK